MATPKTVDEALTDFARAVSRRTFWQDHGTHSDGKLEQARRDEHAARRAVHKAISDEAPRAAAAA